MSISSPPPSPVPAPSHAPRPAAPFHASPLSQLIDPTLLRREALIDGQWIDAPQRFAVTDPASGHTLAEVANHGPEAVHRAAQAAHAAQSAWRALGAKARSEALMCWHELIVAHTQDLARLMTAEQGKPLAEALGEVSYGASFVEWFAQEARRVYGETIASNDPSKRHLVLKQAIGVCAAITPWNFPIAMITRKVAPALAAGCTVIVKPAEQTPLCALALAELAQRAGLPPGVFNVITADAAQSVAVGQALCAHPLVRHLSFTGSTEVGRLLAAQCAPGLKRLSLELGGNAPFLVFDDADIDAAVEGALQSKYRNAGQTCVCANRFYVQRGVADRFVNQLTERVRTLRVGPGFAPDVHIGPLIDEAALSKVERHVADALSHGAQLHTGGQRLGERFYAPTVLSGATAEMLCAREETFGPVAPVFVFDSEAEAIALANATEFGLASYLYTRDIGRVIRVSEALEYGMVGCNTGLISTAEVPFGGIKQSGYGREGARQGLEEYLELKYLCLGGL